MTPTTSADFDRAYRAPFTFWGDPRIPPELTALSRKNAPATSLELGCGVGRFSRHLARLGIRATGVDFSAVAIAKAQRRAKDDPHPPDFRVGDVTRLDDLTGPYAMAFDVGCFHCLDATGQRRYAAEVFRLLAPGATHLVWALDAAPSGSHLAPAVVAATFAPRFTLVEARPSRRRLARSHWYWLARNAD